MDIELDIPGVRASVNNLMMKVERINRQARFVWPNIILDGAAEIAQREIADAAPKGPTGNLAKSVIILRANDRRFVSVTSPYGGFVNDGTRPSEGRYVPAIGKRLASRSRHARGKKQSSKVAPGGTKWWEGAAKEKGRPQL